MNVKRLTQKSLFKTLHPRQNSSSEGVYFVYITFGSASYCLVMFVCLFPCYEFEFNTH